MLLEHEQTKLGEPKSGSYMAKNVDANGVDIFLTPRLDGEVMSPIRVLDLDEKQRIVEISSKSYSRSASIAKQNKMSENHTDIEKVFKDILGEPSPNDPNESPTAEDMKPPTATMENGQKKKEYRPDDFELE